MDGTEEHIDKLFEIDDLKCQYSNNKTVLHIKDLVIERGKITVILGLSGIGKSTILETLGLMNKTLPRDSKLLFYPYKGSNPLNYSTIWYENNEKIRSGVRKQHFSFIFQESNLMYNFTALDNICITLLLQNKTKREAREKIMGYIRDMELKEKVTESTMIYNLSGGERQRLAFIRAIAPDFTVLFGDEPTGNLDVTNATRVLKNLSQSLKTKERSAIIVTHDIRLAIEHADDIILIEERQEERDGQNHSYGYISGHNVFKSVFENGEKMWRNHISSDLHRSSWMKGEITRVFLGEKLSVLSAGSPIVSSSN